MVFEDNEQYFIYHISVIMRDKIIENWTYITNKSPSDFRPKDNFHSNKNPNKTQIKIQSNSIKIKFNSI